MKNVAKQLDKIRALIAGLSLDPDAFIPPEALNNIVEPKCERHVKLVLELIRWASFRLIAVVPKDDREVISRTFRILVEMEDVYGNVQRVREAASREDIDDIRDKIMDYINDGEVVRKDNLWLDDANKLAKDLKWLGYEVDVVPEDYDGWDSTGLYTVYVYPGGLSLAKSRDKIRAQSFSV